MRKITYGLVVITVVAIAASVAQGLTGNWMPGRVLMSVGGILQIDGVALVFRAIWQTEQALGLPSWVGDIGSALDRSVWAILGGVGIRRRKPVVVEPGTARLSISTHAPTVTVAPAAGATAEERLSSAERQLVELRKEQGRLGQRLDQERTDWRAADAKVETRLSGELVRVEEKVAKVGGGSRFVQAIGGVLILVGTALITIGVWC
ncbi:MAG: hypothetical protein ABI401_13360 [Candidatus Dormibacter sp.]